MYEHAGELSVLASGIRAGLTPHLALETMRRSPGTLGQFASAYWAEHLRGASYEDALVTAGAVQEALRPLAIVLALSATEGVRVADHVDRIAADAQLSWHRAQLRAARRLPVQMLFPLITLVLPSFMLLTITPVMFGAIESIRGAL